MTDVVQIAAAVLMLVEEARPATEIADALGVSDDKVRRWLKTLEDAGITVNVKTPTPKRFGRRRVENWSLRTVDVPHKDGCWMHGPAHYWCALDEIHRLEDEAEARRWKEGESLA